MLDAFRGGIPLARAIYARLGRPATALFLLLCFCLLASDGRKAVIQAADGVDAGQHVLVASAMPPSEQAGLIAPLSAAGGFIAALKGHVGSPSLLDPPASLPILAGASWRYFKGILSAPPSSWNTVGFDDSSWPAGPSGFGYGDGDDATLLSDMQNPPNTPGYVSVYIRKEFDIPDLGSIVGVRLTIDFDDAYVVYVNGSEAARSSNMGGTPGTPPAYNATAASNHEASAGSGGNPPNVVIIPSSALVAGTNAIAIEVHNGTLGSSDLTLIPRLENELPPNAPPDEPSDPIPADLATGLSTSPQLCVTVDDEEGAPLDVTFYGREGVGVAGDPFTIIALPDTQYYSASFPATYVAQTTWLRDNRVARNIVFTTELGDCVDTAALQAQWDNANAAWLIAENPATTGLPDGMPYGIAVGNHDQTPSGAARSGSDENITTSLYNQNFGKSRFSGRGYFGGNFPLPGFADSMDNHYELFSAGGMDFISFHLEWDNTSCSWPSDGSAPTPGPLTTCQEVLTWVRGLLTGPYANRRATITTHFMGTPTSGGTGTPSRSPQGQAIFDSIKTLPNVFLLLGGHLDQADHRTDLATDGHPIHTVLSDFQTRPNGGNGWLRIMTFDPQADTIHIETYSPTFDRFINKLNNGTPSSHADNLAPTENEITLDYDMDAGAPFTAAGTETNVPAGLQACVTWPGLQVNTTYEWYAVATDGSSSTAGPRQSFSTTTICSTHSECDDADPCTDDTCNGSQLCEHAPVANCCNTAGDCDDANICTDDACTSNACENTNNNGACIDGNVCTVSDFCSGGTCASGSAANCDDGNACTTDSCVAPTGCSSSYTPTPGCCSTAADCDDGNAGTTDTCTGNNCQNQENVSCSVPADCDDGNACTTDVCSGGNVAAIQFDGTNDHVDLGNSAALNDFGTGSFTVEGWVYTDGGNADRTGIIRFGRQGDFAQVAVQLSGTAAPNLALSGSVETEGAGNQQVDVNYQGTAITANAWHHFAMIVDRTSLPGDPSAQQLRLHIDGGAAIVTNASVWGTTAINSTDNVVFGAARLDTGALGLYYDGRLDEVRIWDGVRTPQQIQDNMNLEVTSAPGLLHRWGLNEGASTLAADSGGASDGTLTNGPVWLTDTAQIPALGPGTCQHTSASCDCASELDCDDGNSCTTDTCGIPNDFALSLDGTNDHVTMGIASGLGATSFTLETWFNWTGGGVPLSASGTGTGGLPTTTIPILSKGAAQAETPANFNMNYFMGIVNGRLAGDFEDTASGLNHPVCTAAAEPAISTNTWHHAAATYDGTRWRLYLDGAELTVDTACSNCTGGACTISPGATPESASIQHFGIGTTLNTSGTAAGFFQGLIDEARVWNVPRSQAAIQADMNFQVSSAPGLLGRWGFDEGTSITAGDSTDPAEDGTLTGGPLWEGINKPALGEGVCQFTIEVGASCDDNNLCLTGDTCDASGICQPGSTPLGCDDGNVCTDDSCDNEFGCVHDFNVAPCNDGNACTMGETCDTGSCSGSSPVVCDDGLVCNGSETCNTATGCVAGTPLNCDDANSCTVDTCGAAGCEHALAPDGTSCSDANACTTGDTCNASGQCVAGAPLSCDDGNVCTDDSCNVATGCVYGNNTSPCADDGNPCTDDVCGGGSCLHPSDDTNACTDSNGCTGDACLAGACSSWYSPAPGCCDTGANCNDGNASTTDTCVGAPDGTCSNNVSGGCTTAAQCNDSSGCTTDACVGAVSTSALNFDGSNDYVTMGSAAGESALGARAFTLEGWIRRDGASWGSTTSTGTGGLTAVPLITKGRGQSESAPLNTNYFLGITAAGRPVADFEQKIAAGGWVVGQNHPICGTATITDQSWHHVAVTYSAADGWRLYVDGVEGTTTEGTSCADTGACNPVGSCPRVPGVEPEYDSTQHFGLGSAIQSTGAREGLFAGLMDEVRVWNVVRTPAQISGSMNQELTSDTGLIGRWGLNEISGTSAADSTSPAQNGTLTESTTAPVTPANGPAWSPGDTAFGASTPGTCTNTPIANCSMCAADYQCGDSNSCSADSCNTTNDAALQFDGVDDYVTMGAAAGTSELGAATFTVETWFYWTGAGAGASTGSGGIASLIPLVAKGAAQAEDPADVNANYILGIAGSRLAADFEDTATGLNHPVCTATTNPTITTNTWHHAAATYDGTSWKLYLDGAALTIDTLCSTCAGGACTVSPGATPEFTSVQHFGLGSMLNSSGARSGFFQGRLDEVRVWNIARSLAQIQGDQFREVSATPNLIGRWSLNDGASTTALDASGRGNNGTLSGPNGLPTWSTTNLQTMGLDTCLHTAVADGTSCSDGSLCTQTDTCQSGTCASGSPVTCSPSDQCHVAGVCDGETGACSNPNAPNGTTCDDGNPVTTSDACTDGVCGGVDLCAAVTCTASDQCHDVGVCNSATGTCSDPPKADGTACTDADACTQTDTCQTGICTSGPLAPPVEVIDLVWIRDLNQTLVLSWTGQGPQYDLAGGFRSQLGIDGGTQNAVCVPGGEDYPSATFEDTRPDPSPGEAYYYLVRSQSAVCGSGTYGYSSAGVEHLPTAACQ